MPSKTVSARQQVVTGTGKLVSVAVVTPPNVGGYSLHDCDDPKHAKLENCISPINFASPDGVSFTKGLVVHTRNDAPETSITVTTA